MNIPSKDDCIKILLDNKTPSNVIKHSKVVCEFAESLIKRFEEKGILINKGLIIASALLHDVEKVKKNHTVEGVKLLNKLGFVDVAKLVNKHGLSHLKKEEYPESYEEKILYYSDKRVRFDKVVSIDERFTDLKKRYNYDFKQEEKLAKDIEKDFDELLK